MSEEVIEKEIIIDDSNFFEYFRDTATNMPKHGECMAIYRSMAEFHSGDLKERMVDALLTNKLGANGAINAFVKEGRTSEKEAIRVCKEITADLINGMSREDVLKKPYTYLCEITFYTKKEYVPKDSPHWQLVNLKNVMIK